MPTVTMRYFAHARDPAGCAEEQLELPDEVDLDAVRAVLLQRHPGLGRILPACRIAHNMEFLRAPVRLAEGDEMAVIPPVSGG